MVSYPINDSLAIKRKLSVEELLKQNILVSPELLEALNNLEPSEVDMIIKSNPKDVLVINEQVKKLLQKNESGVNWLELDRAKALAEKTQKPMAYSNFMDALESQSAVVKPSKNNDISVVSSYNTTPTKREVSDFVGYYSARFKAAQAILSQRVDLDGLVQIDRLKKSSISDAASIIGLVKDKQETKHGHIILVLEDLTGSIKVIINKSRREIFDIAKDIVFDEVVGVSGNLRNGVFFASNMIYPDIPIKDPKSAPEDGFAVFMSDFHFGSSLFLEDDFKKFIKWINGNLGNPSQREIASKVKYIIVAGDLVDGVGVYADQYDELTLKDVREQYKMCADYLAQIPKHIKIVLSPGNHDAVRAAEPQAAFGDDFATPIIQLPNVIVVSNPAMINIGKSESFQGFDVLIYHGYSFDYYVANVNSIRKEGGYDRADLIMKFLLQRRHLAPAHTSTLIIPDPTIDPLFINVVPDIFLTGHVHRTSVSQYKGITLINGSCWQGKTKFQERLGHNPQPSRISVFDLKNGSTKIINFGK
jgi:DNA polymerase II small subunit